MVSPIKAGEVWQALKESTDSAPGLDGVRLEKLKSCPTTILVTVYNTWLLSSYVPTVLSEGVTILIPEAGDRTDPANYRPITMISRITLIFHKVLAKRLESNIVLDPRQKAFIPCDGCADNVFLLDNIIRGAQRRHKPVCLAFLDASKASLIVPSDVR